MNDGAEAVGSVAPTPILDWNSAAVLTLRDDARRQPEVGSNDQMLLIRAHSLIATRVRAVYSVNETQPVSRTIERGRGSCSQKLALLEAVARAAGIPTRVRGLLIDGRFWYPRFPRIRHLLPNAVVLAWPEFFLNGKWLSVSELFGALDTLSQGSGFSNAEGETLFDAVSRTAVDWDGATSTPEVSSTCDLSGNVMSDLGYFNSRDELFAMHGQTLGWPVRAIAEPILGRWSANASRPQV